MKFLALALALFGCLCGGYAQQTAAPSSGSPATQTVWEAGQTGIVASPDGSAVVPTNTQTDTTGTGGTATATTQTGSTATGLSPGTMTTDILGSFAFPSISTGSAFGSPLSDLLGTSAGGTGIDQLVTKIINETGNTPGSPNTQFTAQDVVANMDPSANAITGTTTGTTTGPGGIMNDLLNMMGGGPTATGPTSLGPTGTGPVGTTGTGPSPLDMFPPGTFPPTGPGGAGGFPSNIGLPSLPKPKPAGVDPMMMMMVMNLIGGGEMMEQPEMMLPLVAMMSSQRKQQQPPPMPNPFATLGGGLPTTNPLATLGGGLPNTNPLATLGGGLPTTNPLATLGGGLPTTNPFGGSNMQSGGGPSPLGPTSNSGMGSLGGSMDVLSMMSRMTGPTGGSTSPTSSGPNNIYSDLMNSILAPPGPSNPAQATSPMDSLFPGGMMGR